MSERQVELFGGPRDGERIVVTELYRLLRLFRDTQPLTLVMASIDDAPPSTSDLPDVDTYELMEWKNRLVYVHPAVVRGLERGGLTR